MARKRITKRKICQPKLPMQRQLRFGHEGRYFDLKAVCRKVNERYFGSRLRGYTIVWGRRRKQPPRSYFVFGSIQEDDRIIRIHPLLDQRFVPGWFLEYVVYHEMLHAFVPDEFGPRGRRIVHTAQFKEREKKFRYYRRARLWETENLARFLQ